MPRVAASIFFLKGRLEAPFTADEANEKPWGESYPGGSEATFRFKPPVLRRSEVILSLDLGLA